MPKSGFTLIELLLVIAIMGFLGMAVLPFSSNLLSRNAVEAKTHELYSFIKTAQLNSMLGKANSNWGVIINNNTVYLFAGSSFADRNTVFDQKIMIPAGVNITPAELVFSKSAGELNQEHSLVISGQLKSKTLSISRFGVVNVN